MINIGIVGYGYWGPNLVATLPRRRGQGRCRRRPRHQQAGRGAAALPGGQDHHRLPGVLDDPAIDAIAIATPVSTHFELAMAALQGRQARAGREADDRDLDAGAAADRGGRAAQPVLMVDHTFIYTGAVQQDRASSSTAGDLGEVYYYDSIRVNLGLFQRDVNVIWDLAVHDFSILDYLLGEHPVAVSATGINHFPARRRTSPTSRCSSTREPIAHTQCQLAGAGQGAPDPIGGSKKMIVYDDLEPSEKIKVYDKGVSFTDDPRRSRRCVSATAPATCGRPSSTAPRRCASRARTSSTAS